MANMAAGCGATNVGMHIFVTFSDAKSVNVGIFVTEQKSVVKLMPKTEASSRL